MRPHSRSHAQISQRNFSACPFFFFPTPANMFSERLALSESAAPPPPPEKDIFDWMSAKGHRLAINTMSNAMQSSKAVQECVQSGAAMWRSGARSDQRTLSSQNTGEDEELVTDGRLSASQPRRADKGTRHAMFFFFLSLSSVPSAGKNKPRSCTSGNCA